MTRTRTPDLAPWALALAIAFLGACAVADRSGSGGYGDDDDDTPPSDDDDDDDDDAWYDGDDGSDEPPLDDDDPVDVDDADCGEAVEEPVTWYQSADDSNSTADATHLRDLIAEDALYPQWLRRWEFLNYYDFGYAPAEPDTVRVVPQLRADPVDPDVYTLLVGVVAPTMSVADRPPYNLTFSVDVSGSMGSGGLDMAKASMRATAAALREGDVVSVAAWNTSNAVLLDSLVVDGPDDEDLLDVVDGLLAGGSTDLESGLEAAYALAAANFAPERINRVVLLSDGGANTGITSETLIAEHAEDGEGEAIYLVGVGAPPASKYNDLLMDTVTDLGKGAYVYVDSETEAERAFGPGRLEQTMAIAARDVRLELTLPPGFLIERFSGEETSTDPDEVEPQHLAPNDAMLYHQLLRDCSSDEDSGALTFDFTVTWHDLVTGEPHTEAVTASVDELLEAPAAELLKADAILAYVDAMEAVWGLEWTDREPFLMGVADGIGSTAEFLGDDELSELTALAELAASRF